MYLTSEKPRRRDSPWRVMVLVVLIILALYVVHEQLGGASWARPFAPTPTPTRSAESYFDEAEALYDEGLLDKAIVAYELAFRADPDDNASLARLARLLVIKGRADEVLAEYGTRLQDPSKGDARTLSALGMALDWHAPFNDEALLPVYIKLDVIDEKEVQGDDWLYTPERVASELVRAAQKVCEQAIRLDPDLPEAHAYMAEALADRERLGEAESVAQTAVELNPNNPDAQRALAYAYESQGKYELAVEAYKAAISAHPRLGFLHLKVGRTYRYIGQQLQMEARWEEAKPYFEQAVVYFEEAIKLDPDNPISYDEIGWTYGYYMGDDREVKQRGVDYLEEALNQDPNYALGYRHLGQVYYHLQSYEEAVVAFERGLALGDMPPADAAWSHILMGWSFFALDKEAKGQEHQCDRALAQFQAAYDILSELSQRELGLEQQAIQGLDACE